MDEFISGTESLAKWALAAMTGVAGYLGVSVVANGKKIAALETKVEDQSRKIDAIAETVVRDHEMQTEMRDRQARMEGMLEAMSK